jgi:hypothetical protein
LLGRVTVSRRGALLSVKTSSRNERTSRRKIVLPPCSRCEAAPFANNFAFIEYDLAILNAHHGPELVIEELLSAGLDVFS